MIILMEPVYYSWVHEEVNAGMLKLISGLCEEPVLYIGEREHIKCIRRLYGENTCFAEISRLLPHSEIEALNSVTYYSGLIKGVIRKYNPKHLFILGAFYPCIMAAEIVSLSSKCKFHVVLHGMVEPDNKKHHLYKMVIGFCRYMPNVDFITYSPHCRADYWKIQRKKMIFIHHPFIKADLEKKRKSRDDDTLRIGIIGACANRVSREVVARLNEMNLDSKLEFWVLSKFENRFKNTSNAKLINASFDRGQMQRIMQELDFILIPYGKDEYTMSASGVLWDAVSNEIPCFMLDSKYLTYYNKRYNIGCQAVSISQLCEMVKDKITEENEIRLHLDLTELENYNIKKMKDILYGV